MAMKKRKTIDKEVQEQNRDESKDVREEQKEGFMMEQTVRPVDICVPKQHNIKH